MPISIPYSIIFVGGAPRSGTTILHTLICSATETNRHVGESSYLTGLIKSYRVGLIEWNNHTRHFFASKADFCEHMRSLLLMSLNVLKFNLGNPEILALKDPLLTPYFPLVNELLGEDVRFVTVLRNPYDVIRSRQDVFERSHPNAVFDSKQVGLIAEEFMRSYQHIEELESTGRLHLIKYEDLSNHEELDRLTSFLKIGGLSDHRMIQDAFDQNSPWYSPKYGRPVDLSRRLSPLDNEYKLITNKICKSIQLKYGYEST